VLRRFDGIQLRPDRDSLYGRSRHAARPGGRPFCARHAAVLRRYPREAVRAVRPHHRV